MVDDTESDLAFFIKHPRAFVRVRLPFENEYSAAELEPGRHAVVRIEIRRDPSGLPMRRAKRRLCFCNGGRA
jgi:hypothetical protein